MPFKARSSATCLALLFVVAACLQACGGRAYVYDHGPMDGIRARAEAQADGDVRVSASVLGEDETRELFGVQLYDQGIQPVWIEIENRGAGLMRYAPAGTDRFYFSPLEVAYKNRGPFSDAGRSEMERRFHELSVPRYVDPGETRSGFVFTHARPGAKAFNVDVFGNEDSHHFSFLVRVPGFVPDYANVDFDSLYPPDDVVVHDESSIAGALRGLGCCSADESGESTLNPINVVLIGGGADLLIALLRSGWTEMSADVSASEDPHFLFGRKQDAIFRHTAGGSSGYYELRLWLAPAKLAEDRVWAGEVKHVLTHRWIVPRDDPDVDNAREFLSQNLWYSQALLKVGQVTGPEVVPVENFWANLLETQYFTDGVRNVYWLSGDPVSLLDTETVDWDDATVRAK